MYVRTAMTDADTPNAATRPPTNAGTRNRLRSSIGVRWRRSITTNAASRTAAAAKHATTVVAPQPSDVERMSPTTSADKAALNVASPGQSGRRAAGSNDSSTDASVTASAARPIGTLTKKIQRQSRAAMMTPPSTGPIASATPVTPPNTPNATPRSGPRNAFAIRASAVAN